MNQALQAKAEALLSQRELDALKKASESPSKLSPATAAQFYALFLQGYSCEEIAKTNKSGPLGLGLIVRARLEYDWDVEKDKYVRELMANAKTSIEKMTLEGIQFASDGMAVFHKLMGERFRKFLQTGDQEVLGDFKEMSFKSYREFVQLFQSMSGTGSTTGPRPMAAAPEITPAPTASETLMPDENKPISADDAASMLKLLS